MSGSHMVKDNKCEFKKKEKKNMLRYMSHGSWIENRHLTAFCHLKMVDEHFQ